METGTNSVQWFLNTFDLQATPADLLRLFVYLHPDSYHVITTFYKLTHTVSFYIYLKYWYCIWGGIDKLLSYNY